jgi:hypothetical protein
MTKTNIDITQTLDIAMAKKLGSIKRNGLKIILHSGEEIFVCFASKKTVYFNDPKDVEDLGRWLVNAANAMKKEKRKRNKK